MRSRPSAPSTPARSWSSSTARIRSPRRTVRGSRCSAAPQGINAARNRAAALAAGDLLAFLDDDVELWPTWRTALWLRPRRTRTSRCFGGPIRPRLEGPRRTAAAARRTPRSPRWSSVRRPRRRLRLGRELRDPPLGLRGRRALRRDDQPLRRRGGLAAAAEGSGRAGPLRRRRRRRPPPRRRRRPAARARPRRLPPRPRRARLRRAQGDGAADERRAARARRHARSTSPATGAPPASCRSRAPSGVCVTATSP